MGSGDDLDAAVTAEASRCVGLGKMSEAEIVDWLNLLFQEELESCADVETVVLETVRTAIAHQLEDQRSWPDVTDCDRLDRVFADLSRNGIITSAGETLSLSDAHFELKALLDEQPDARGYAFFHSQDLDDLVVGEESDLYIGFWHRSGDATDVREVGREVAEELRSSGFSVDWDDDPDTRLLVTIVWLKRWSQDASR